MAGAGIAMTGFDEAKKKLAALAAIPTQDQLNRIANFAKADIQKHFDDSGPGWAPNAPSTIFAKKSSKPLIDKSGLKNSLSPRVEGKSVIVFTRKIYAAVQNFGHTFNRSARKGKLWVFNSGGKTVFTQKIRAHTIKIPARKFMYFSAEFFTMVKSILLEPLK